MAGSFTASTIDALNNVVKAIWQSTFNPAANNQQWRDLVTDLGKSSALTETLTWMGELPDMEDATRDTTHFGGVARYSYAVTKKEWKAGLRVRLMDLETDSTNSIKTRVEGLIRRVEGHPGRLAVDQLEANPIAFDGAALFANTHAFGAAANFDNLLAGSGVTAADIETDIATARATMMRGEDDKGEPMETTIDTFVIPPELSLVFQKVLGPARQVGGDTLQIAATPPTLGNKWTAGGYTVYEYARLTDANNWYAMHTGGEIKPFVFSWATMPYLMNTPSGNDDSAKHRSELEYVVRGVYNVGVGMPQHVLSIVN